MATTFHTHIKLLFWPVILMAGLSMACSLGSKGGGSFRIATLPTVTPTVAAQELPSNAAPAEAANAAAVDPPAQPNAPAAAAQPEVAPPVPNTAPRFVPQAGPTVTAGPALAAPPAPVPTTTPTLPAPTAGANQPVAIVPTPTVPPPPKARPTPAMPPAVSGWSFVGVRATIDNAEAVVVGEMVNNTGLPQTSVYVSGQFYNLNNQLIDSGIDVLSHVPVDTIPPGGRVPFELAVESGQPIFRLNLFAMSEPASNPPRQNFEVSNVNQWISKTNAYCLSGNITNPASPLEDYLVVMAVAYNDQNTVANFGEYSVAAPQTINEGGKSNFEMCMDPLGQNIARHQVMVVGY